MCQLYLANKLNQAKIFSFQSPLFRNLHTSDPMYLISIVRPSSDTEANISKCCGTLFNIGDERHMHKQLININPCDTSLKEVYSETTSNQRTTVFITHEFSTPLPSKKHITCILVMRCRQIRVSHLNPLNIPRVTATTHKSYPSKRLVS